MRGSVDWVLACKPNGSIPNQGTCLGLRPGPWQGVCERQPHIDVSLSFSLPSPLSKDKNKIKSFNKTNQKKYKLAVTK